ncbi:MAG TPA: GNAT family N-acetyltransferase [Caldisericia bacterium]|nr:GNAT family N-acetyltransferase [Caldisericia bacterium]HPF48407.1 GNAT family N-acetyltransferase [Caldisericia bacterium]HPI83413.1 GNAT family N-acetyltransferase [Caldisericia bacterium]HPQ92861.1 GNAT family N-acetyltransferase [Caldisericia bacterium]HRV74041.1 GNAT family N-acetyltransferase [Caldisericia bacterium]
MIEILKVNSEELLGNLFDRYKEYMNIKQRCLIPDSAPIPDEAIKRSISKEGYDIKRCLAFADGQIVGHVSAIEVNSFNPNYEQDKGLVDFNGFVLPEFRNQGIGSGLSRKVLGELDSTQIRSISTYTTDDAGARFCKRIGGRLVAQDSLRAVELKDIDWGLVKAWKEIEFRKDMQPVTNLHKKLDMALIEEIIDLSYAINIEIKELDMNESTHTLEQEKTNWCDTLKYWDETGINLECITLKDSVDSLVGYTLCMFMPDAPDVVGQSITAVWKHLRGNGYGKLLKALMLENIRDNHPQVKRIETENNDLNAPMVAINEKLGFKVKNHYYFYKLDHEKAMNILKQHV